MKKNKDTIILAKIRRYIREAIKWHKVDDGMPEFWTTKDYKGSKPIKGIDSDISNSFYYTKSGKAIEEIAKKIYNLLKSPKHSHNNSFTKDCYDNICADNDDIKHKCMAESICKNIKRNPS
ncbi:hypothetical protein LCGC14_2982400 [marine sediment metagenome]|uniref:Uncharacterized protein n=1 Tax=marine sediment metagenome TaxID=412755 RepID=A0A0F8XTQ7_9ZZZZ